MRFSQGELEALETTIEDAVRKGLVECEKKGLPNWRMQGWSSIIRQHVLEALVQGDPTNDEIADWIQEHGGIMRVSDMAVVGRVVISADRLAAGYRVLSERYYEKLKEQDGESG